MLIAPESLKTARTQSAPVSETATRGQGKSDSPISLVCNLADGSAFYPNTNTPPVSVLSVFGADRLHQCRLEGSWDLERAIKENPDCLIRSYRNLLPNNNSHEWEDLIFKFGNRAFLCADKRRVVGYAAHHLLLMICKYGEEFLEPPPMLPSGWATVLYLYDIR
jgi:hypothetical protein